MAWSPGRKLRASVFWEAPPAPHPGPAAASQVAGLLRNGWPVSAGTAGRFAPESVADFTRNAHLCGEGRVGEISLSSLSEAAAGAGVCLRGFGLA